MKVLLSWLREFAPIDGDPVGARRRAERPGHGRRGVDVHRRGPRRHRRGPGARPAPAPRRRQDPAGRRRRRRRRGAADRAAARSTWRVGDLVPLATVGTDDARRHGDRPAQDAGRVVQRDAVLGPRARARRRPRRHPHPRPEPAAPGTPLAEALGIEPDVLCDLEVNPNRPDAMSVAGVARDLAARLRRAVRPARRPVVDGGRRPTRIDGVRSRSSTPTCAAGSPPGCCGASTVGPSDPADRPAPHAARHAADQQRWSTCPTT